MLLCSCASSPRPLRSAGSEARLPELRVLGADCAVETDVSRCDLRVYGLFEQTVVSAFKAPSPTEFEFGERATRGRAARADGTPRLARHADALVRVCADRSSRRGPAAVSRERRVGGVGSHRRAVRRAPGGRGGRARRDERRTATGARRPPAEKSRGRDDMFRQNGSHKNDQPHSAYIVCISHHPQPFRA